MYKLLDAVYGKTRKVNKLGQTVKPQVIFFQKQIPNWHQGGV